MDLLNSSNGLLDEAAVAAVTIGLVQLLKKYINARFVPLSSVVIAVVLALVAGGPSLESGIKGIIIGLTASGLYDQKALAS